MILRFVTVFVVALLVCALSPGTSHETRAQSAKGDKSDKGGGNPPNAFQGFSRDRDEPVRIEANSLEIHDKDSYALFSGNVTVQQGDSVLRTRELKVYYQGSLRPKEKGEISKLPGTPAVTNDPAQRIRRLEALGGVTVTNKDQKASGDLGVFDMPTNTATITGNVVISQGPNVMRADKLIVDLKTGYSRLEAGGKGGPQRVQGLFLPSSIDEKKKQQK
jgi:lipopolysaccharide export system protein LptA